MVASRFLLCLALLLLATISRAADMEGSPEWVQKKLAAGDADAIVELGNKYAAGSGIPQDGKKAIALFMAAAVGSPRADCCIGLAFANGMGVPRDDIKAMDWYKAAALDGYVPALDYLGRAYSSGIGGPPDYTRAFNCLRQAANFGYPLAQADLGFMYQQRLGTKPDLVESLKWLQIAVNAGFSQAVSKRDEVNTLLDSSQKEEALRRIKAFKPITNYIPVLDDSQRITVPLGNYFQIPVKIFGQTNSLVVDTGASCAALDVVFQDRLGEPLASLQGSTIASSTAIFGYRDCPEFFVGERRFAPLLTVVGNFKKLQQAFDEPLQGVIGMSCLKSEVLCFDSDHDLLSIGGSVPETIKKAALGLPLQRHSSFQYGINVYINGRGPIFLSMDSGAASGIVLNESDWRTVFSGKPLKSRSGRSIDAEGTVVDKRSARIQNLTIGTNHYNNLIAESLANTNLDSSFGQEFIRRHLCYVDFPHLMLYLLPGRNFARSDEYNMSGLWPVKIDDKIKVYSVDDDSPASKTAISDNDQILSINGHDAASLPLKFIYDTLKTKPGDEIKMQIKRGAQTNSVTFRLKRLL